jgi:hypothetical protein
MVKVDGELLEAAARKLGVTPGADPARKLRHVLAAIAPARASAISGGGAAPKRAGRAWENDVVQYARDHGFPEWDRAPLRGRRDLLDLTGTLPLGFLIGCKSVIRGVPAAEKLWEAMDQNRRAMENLRARGGETGDMVPVQIIRRPARLGERAASPVGRAYAVMEFDDFLRLARERRGWRAS